MLKVKGQISNVRQTGFTLTPKFAVTSQSQEGFTLLELVVVIAIMGMFLGLVTVDLASGRTDRNLNIAQNELISNIRKIQSYTLSARNVSGSQPASYYVLKFDLTTPDRYTIQAMYNVTSSPKLQDIETIAFPQGIRLSVSNPITINRSSSPAIQNPNSCVLIAFKSPFARTYLGAYNLSDGNCTSASSVVDITNTDDQKAVLDFVVNTDNIPVSADSDIVIRLTDNNNTQPGRKILVKGVIGLICPTTTDETKCAP